MLRRQWPGVAVVLVRFLCATILTVAILTLFVLPSPALSVVRHHLTDPRALMFNFTGEEALASQLRGTAQWVMGQFRAHPDTRPGVPVAHTHLPPFGVNTELEQEVEPEKRDLVLRMIAEAGFKWIRQPFGWYDIEIHAKDDFEDRRNVPYRSAWDKYDQIVDLAESYDLGIIARLGAPPSWSRHDGTERGAFGPPDRNEDFADFAAAVATRYAGRITYYQLWNEPNVYPEWGNQPVDPQAYTDLLCLTYHRIKLVDPNAVIISGAMAQTQELGTWNADYRGNNMMDTIFLQRMYAAGAGECFDIMAVNDYMLWSGPTDQRLTHREVNFSRPMWLRDIMVANGDAHKPIWISEMNSNAAPEDIPDRYGRVTLEQQARWAPLAFERIQREWPWAGVTTVWFFKKATDAEQQDPSYYFRLLDPDFTPMPVYHALSTYFNDLEPTLYRGFHQETTWQVTYTGSWEDVAAPHAILGSYRRTTAPGATLTLAWEGRSLWLHPGPGQGTLQVRDGAGRLRELTLSEMPIRLDHSLLPERRRITLTVVAGEVSVDALEVR